MKKKFLSLLFFFTFSFLFSETYVKILPIDPRKMSEIKIDGKILSIQVVESTVGKDHEYIVLTYSNDSDCIVPATDAVISEVKD